MYITPLGMHIWTFHNVSKQQWKYGLSRMTPLESYIYFKEVNKEETLCVSFKSGLFSGRIVPPRGRGNFILHGRAAPNFWKLAFLYASECLSGLILSKNGFHAAKNFSWFSPLNTSFSFLFKTISDKIHWPLFYLVSIWRVCGQRYGLKFFWWETWLKNNVYTDFQSYRCELWPQNEGIVGGQILCPGLSEEYNSVFVIVIW